VKSEDGALLGAEYNAAKPLIDWNIEEGKDDMKIRGLSEYGWAMWCRWSRTSPINLPMRVPWHTLARLTN